MKTVAIECPDPLHEPLRRLVEAGVVEALRRYLSGHSVELQEKQIMADVGWGAAWPRLNSSRCSGRAGD